MHGGPPGIEQRKCFLDWIIPEKLDFIQIGSGRQKKGRYLLWPADETGFALTSPEAAQGRAGGFDLVVEGGEVDAVQGEEVVEAGDQV
ncbi:MAG: hypothetical protein WBO24_01785 [Nitrospirales bacterium]